MIPNNIRKDKNAVSSFITLIIVLAILFIVWEAGGSYLNFWKPTDLLDPESITQSLSIRDKATGNLTPVLTTGWLDFSIDGGYREQAKVYQLELTTNAPYKLIAESYKFIWVTQGYNPNVPEWTNVQAESKSVGSLFTNTFRFDLTHQPHPNLDFSTNYWVNASFYTPEGLELDSWEIRLPKAFADPYLW